MEKNQKLKKKFSFDSIFENKTLMIIFSVLCSIFIWYSVYTEYGGEDERIIKDVPITINDDMLKSQYGLEMIEVISPTDLKELKMDIKVTSNNPIVRAGTADDYRITADLSNVTEVGNYPIDLKIECINSKLNVEISPDNQQYITVRFDRIKESTYEVLEVRAFDVNTEDGYIIEKAYSNVTNVTVRGPDSVVNMIDHIKIEAQANETITSTKSYDGSIVYYNKNGDIIESEYLSNNITENVIVTVPIKAIKVLKLDVEFENIPSGYTDSMINYTVSPSEITVKGTENAIASSFPDDTYIVGKINFSNISPANNSFEFQLNFSSGIESTEEISEVTVTIDLSQYDTITLTAGETSSFTTMNIGTLTDVDIITKQLKNIRICGPRSQLSLINPSDITVYADMSSKQTYSKVNCIVPAKVVLSKYNMSWIVGTYDIEVRIN